MWLSSVGFGVVDFGFRFFGVGFWVWVSGFGFCFFVLGFGFWVSDYGFQVLSFGCWAVGVEFGF